MPMLGRQLTASSRSARSACIPPARCVSMWQGTQLEHEGAPQLTTSLSYYYYRHFYRNPSTKCTQFLDRVQAQSKNYVNSVVRTFVEMSLAAV